MEAVDLSQSFHLLALCPDSILMSVREPVCSKSHFYDEHVALGHT